MCQPTISYRSLHYFNHSATETCIMNLERKARRVAASIREMKRRFYLFFARLHLTVPRLATVCALVGTDVRLIKLQYTYQLSKENT